METNDTSMERHKNFATKTLVWRIATKTLLSDLGKLWNQNDTSMEGDQNKFCNKNIIMEGKNETWGTLEPK